MPISFSSINHARWSRLTALAVCISAGAVCLWLLVRLAWLLVPQDEEIASAAPAATPSTAAPVQSIAKWHLFGNSQNSMLARAARAPTTTLKLTLRGTLALQDAKQGMAMIEDEHGNERAYKIGEDVVDGAKLVEVYTDHVVLSHEGASETLNLPQPEAHAPETPETQQRNLSTLTSSPSTGAAAPKASSVPPNYTPPQVAQGSDWNKVQKSLRLDADQLAKQVRMEPVYENGKLAGARLSAGGQIGTLISQAGLKPTDTITAVNGASVTNLSNLQQMTENLQNASSLQVTVLRDGKPATLTVNLRQ